MFTQRVLLLSFLAILCLGHVVRAEESGEQEGEDSAPAAVLPPPGAVTEVVAEEDQENTRVERSVPLEVQARAEHHGDLNPGPGDIPVAMGFNRGRYPSDRRHPSMRDRCYINGRWVPHGSEQPFSSINPCWTKLCWYGRLTDRGDGCHYEGSCYPLNRHFTFRCNTMSCTKRMTGPGSYQYRVESVRPGCQSLSGRCMAPGDNGFSGRIQGRPYRNCMCRHDGYMMCFNDRRH